MSILLGCLGNSSDPYFSSVTLLVHFNGANGGTSFPDNSSYARTVTPHGNVNTSTANYKFPTASALFDGSGDCLTSLYVTADFNWWASDFTVECFVYATSLTGWYYLDGTNRPTLVGNASISSTTNYWSFGIVESGKIALGYFNGASQRVVSTLTVSLNTWTHIAVVKNSSGINLFVGGVGMSPVAVAGTPQSSVSTEFVIGQINNTSITGNVDELRISKVARYTANFTPPSQPFPNY